MSEVHDLVDALDALLEARASKKAFERAQDRADFDDDELDRDVDDSRWLERAAESTFAETLSAYVDARVREALRSAGP